jgi:protein tyrosine phosphatase (PTP) superfamily phosphohydrolase (DUF442 family)
VSCITLLRRTIASLALVLVAFLVAGNVLIAAAWQLQSRRDLIVDRSIDGVPNLHIVDRDVWRSAAPSSRAYDDLAAVGVRTIVDLRAEEDLEVDPGEVRANGIEWVHLPIRDGQVPTPTQVSRFLAAVERSDGITLVHCGAGVGRTGAMSAAYLVASGVANGRAAMQQNLAVGPPSLEQLAFAAELDHGVRRPSAVLVAASRVLDAPRRLWSRYGL